MDNPKHEALATLALAWQMYFPTFPAPPDRLFSFWFNRHPLDTILAAIEFAATEREFDAAEYAAQVISASLATVTYTE